MQKNLGSPLNSGILVKCYVDSGVTKSGLFDPKKQGKMVPCVEIVKVGPKVEQVKEGQWALVNQAVQPKAIVIQGEIFHLIKEYDLLYVYDEPPTMDEVYNSDASVTQDLTPYVDIEPFKNMKAKFRNEEGELVTLKGDKIPE
jgi:co-chaperonin GroES (HSP10)